jgi:hypothetical protein
MTTLILAEFVNWFEKVLFSKLSIILDFELKIDKKGEKNRGKV